MSAKQIKELSALGMSAIPADYYPAGWLDGLTGVNLNRCRIFEAHAAKSWGSSYRYNDSPLFVGLDFDPERDIRERYATPNHIIDLRTTGMDRRVIRHTLHVFEQACHNCEHQGHCAGDGKCDPRLWTNDAEVAEGEREEHIFYYGSLTD